MKNNKDNGFWKVMTSLGFIAFIALSLGWFNGQFDTPQQREKNLIQSLKAEKQKSDAYDKELLIERIELGMLLKKAEVFCGEGNTKIIGAWANGDVHCIDYSKVKSNE